MTTERDLGEEGLRQALDRLQQRVAGGADDAKISLAEAMEWCYSLGKYHVEQLQIQLGGDRTRALHAFEQRRRSSSDGETQAALEWVRGFSTHGLLATASFVMTRLPQNVWSGPGGPRGGRVMVTRGGLNELCWKQRSELPPRGDTKKGRDMLYDSRVAGQPVLSPLTAAAAFLMALH